MTKKSNKMTVEEFCAEYYEAPFDEETLTSIAADVEGEIGATAVKLINARKKFYAALKTAGYVLG